VRSALLVMLGDDDWAVRRAALRALGEAVEVGDSAVEARLCELLTAASWKIRAVAAEGFEMLGARGRGHATHSLLEVLEDDEDWAVRKAAAAALAKVAAMGDMVALDALLASGAYDSDWRVRKQALLATGAIAQRGCEVAVQGLLLGLEDVYVERCGSVLDICSRQDCDVRATAVRMLELVAAPGDPRVLAALQRCLGECEDGMGGGKFEEALRCAINDSAARASLLP
jgi:HEAT repeat protein